MSNQSLYGQDVTKQATTSLNVTFQTTAIRALLQCTPIEQVTNTSTWLEEVTANDIPDINDTANLTGLSKGYILRQLLFENTSASTGVDGTCCGNGTRSNPQKAVNGDWSALTMENLSPDGYSLWPFTDRTWPIPFVTKWVVGNPIRLVNTRGNTNSQLFFQDPPVLQAAICKPTIEQAEAKVIVDPETGSVYSSELKSTPQPIQSPWGDVFVPHEVSNPVTNYTLYSGQLNFTTSFGILFMDAMLGAIRLTRRLTQHHSDNAFDIRETNQGENMDLMTYSMYSLVKKDADALLNYTTLVTSANQTFQTFFRHFVNSKLSTSKGNWAYQEIGDQAFEKLSKPVIWDGMPPIKQYSASETNRTVVVSVTNRVQVLHMNAAATYLSAAIVIWLIATATMITCIQRKYTSSMLRNVELLADVLVLVAGSENLLALVQEKGVELKRDGEIKTKLGWFKGSDGEVRWGVEVVGGRNPVQWVDAPKSGTF